MCECKIMEWFCTILKIDDKKDKKREFNKNDKKERIISRPRILGIK